MARLEQYDAIVIGSGQAAGQLCDALAGSGRRTALIERAHLGGTCVNEGCTPTKTMVASARIAYLARRAADYGVHTGLVTVDMKRVRQRKRQMVKAFGGGQPMKKPTTAGLDLIVGEARFMGPKTLEVSSARGPKRRLGAEWIFVNVGCRPARPSIPGIDDVPTLDSTSIMELDEAPEHLVILGGGYVGLEFGQMFRRFGSRVTVVHRGEQLLGREDADVADAVAAILREDGIAVRLETATERIEHVGKKIRLWLRTPDGEKSVIGSHLLVATGRVPSSEQLDVRAAGLHTDARGFIQVNERLETSVPGVWALGDVKGGAQFTHISYDDYRIVAANLLEGGDRTTHDRPVPYVVYIDPQLGRIGMTENEARSLGHRVRVSKVDMNSIARAIETDETRGLIKVVVDGATDQILGAAVLGIEGGEVMAMIQLAMLGKLPYQTLRDGVFAHPSLAEALNSLCWSWEAEG